MLVPFSWGFMKDYRRLMLVEFWYVFLSLDGELMA
jgi:hypothetical protein